MAPQRPNPWTSIPGHAPYVLDADAKAIEVFNRRCTTACQIQTHLVPEPFFDPFEAPIVVLLLNPGVHDDDAHLHATSKLRDTLLGNLRRVNGEVPHVHLAFESSYPGAAWWLRAVTSLKRTFSVELIARSMLAVEYFPYHSKAFRHSAIRLPSQEFGFSLVRDAMSRGALIALARGREYWFGAIPELADYPERIDPINQRRFSLSQGNFTGGYAKICRILEAANR